jgi:hypothetical protein
MDKYNNLVKLIGQNYAILVTDFVPNASIYGKYKFIEELIQLKFNFPPSRFGDILRNIVKFLVIPIQSYKLRIIYNYYKPDIVHAVPIYYMLICAFAKIPYVGTIQAGEIAHRATKSFIYRKFAHFAVKNSRHIIVDSAMLKIKIFNLFKIESIILKDGFDTDLCLEIKNIQRGNCEYKIFSMRGAQKLYRIHMIIDELELIPNRPVFSLAYPFFHSSYLEIIKKGLHTSDLIFGKLSKKDLYMEMATSLLVISIPFRDSSPRSVYEAIFCGAIVAITDNDYYYSLPPCMKCRVIIVDVCKTGWLNDAINSAKLIRSIDFIPSEEALEYCNSGRATSKLYNTIYNVISL